MSLWSRLRGVAIGAYLGEGALRGKRRFASLSRKVGADGSITFFHQPDDAHSHLLAQVLPRVQARYDVDIKTVIVPAPSVDVDHAPVLRHALARRDARLLARHFELDFPDAPAEIEETRRRRAEAVLLKERETADQLMVNDAIGRALFRGDGEAIRELVSTHGAVGGQKVRATIEENYELLRERGHYQGGTIAYAGEWYVGIDRVQHFADRLADERKLPRETVVPRRDTAVPSISSLSCFFSFRSPYSYIAIERLARAAEERRFDLTLRPVLPLVMRGFEVPKVKKMYFIHDASREARRHEVPFGRVCDPLGDGVSRCLAVFHRADQVGRGLLFARAALRGIFSEALDMSTNAGLQKVAKAARLDAGFVRDALEDQSYLERIETNRVALRKAGLWGVPSFVDEGERAYFGQDRLFLLLEGLGADRAPRPLG